MDGNLYLVEDKGKFGFIDCQGNIIIDLIYDYARNFNDGVAWVNIGGTQQCYGCDGGKWGFIDKKGNIIREIDLELVNLVNFTEGLSWVMQGESKYKGVWGIIDITGKWVVEPEFDFSNAYSFQNGMAIVESKRKKGYVDASGKIIFEPQFDSVGGYSDGMSWVNIGAEEDYDGYLFGGKWALVDKKGQFIIDFIYDDAYNFCDDVAWVLKDSVNGKWGLINKEGNQILDFLYDEIFNFSENKALVKFNSNWAYINKKGDIIKTLRNDIQKIKSFKGKTAKIKTYKDKHYGLINSEGEIILEPIYEKIRDSDCAAWVKTEESWLIFNKESKKLIELDIQFDSVNDFIKNEARICVRGNKWGLVNKTGEILAKPQYAYINYYRDGFMWVNVGGKHGYGGIRGGKWGVIDIKGQFIVEPIFDWIWHFWDDELLEVTIGDKKGYATWKGKIIWLK
ncbi:MAG: WG repeat-containing protein [Promethearchaeota archaeon]